MTTVSIPEGLEPLAVWDANDSEWRDGIFSPRFFWLTARTDIRHIREITRIEFHLLDAPFAVVWRFAHSDKPVVVPLAGLPPEHLLKG